MKDKKRRRRELTIRKVSLYITITAIALLMTVIVIALILLAASIVRMHVNYSNDDDSTIQGSIFCNEPISGPEVDASESSTDENDAYSARIDNAGSVSIWTGWTMFEAGCTSPVDKRGDSGRAYGRFQFDERYSLSDFCRFAAESVDEFAGLSRDYAITPDGNTVLIEEHLNEDWVYLSNVYPDEFVTLQAQFAYLYYYKPVHEGLLEYNIDLADYGPVTRGTLWSLAIYDGVDTAITVAQTTYNDTNEIEWLEEIYTYTKRAYRSNNRWSGDEQKKLAMSVYDKDNSGEIPHVASPISFSGETIEEFAE